MTNFGGDLPLVFTTRLRDFMRSYDKTSFPISCRRCDITVEILKHEHIRKVMSNYIPQKIVAVILHPCQDFSDHKGS